MTKSLQTGFIGTGLMGLPMSRRLLEAGFEVTVWNRTREKLRPALKAGATEAATPAELGRDADIILCCVLDAAAVEEVIFGEDGLVETAGPDKILVDHSSISPAATRAFSRRLTSESGMRWVDAPVSGGTKGAEEGSLVILAGGREEDVDAVRPVLSAYSSRVTHFGESGSGQAAKLCNQVIAGTAMLTTVEALRLASDAGIDISKLPEAFSGGMADSLPFQLFTPRIINPPEKPIGHLVSMLKDLESALDLGAETRSPMPITTAAASIYRKGIEKGHAEDEPTVFYSLYRSEPEEFS